MSAIMAVLYPQATRLVAIVILLTLYGFTRLPQLPASERAMLAARFSFTSTPLPELPLVEDAERKLPLSPPSSPPLGGKEGGVRDVHPSLEHISAWISSVGASVALNDLDGDGLSNDVCYVHTSSNQVIVAPVLGTPNRYQAFALDPETLPYDPATMAPMGCLPGDLNEDGLMDLLVYYWGRTPIAFLRRSATPVEASSSFPPFGGDPAGAYMPYEVMPGGAGIDRWFTNAATIADLDGDGHADLIIGNYFQDGARILDAAAGGSDAMRMQHSMSRAYNAGRNRLLLWTGASAGAQPTVHFKEMDGVLSEMPSGVDQQIAHGWTLAVGAADLDGDLLPELYFANDFGPDRLLHNRSQPGQLQFETLRGKKGLTSPNSKVLGRDSFKGMGTDFGDLNGDGFLDIYVSNIAAEYSLEESHFVYLSTGELEQMKNGLAPYVDRSEQLGLSRSGWGWEARLADFDNDGVLEAVQATGFVKGVVNRWPELHELAMGNDELLSRPHVWPRFQPGDDLSGRQHNPFFVRGPDGRYYDLAHELHLDAPQVSRGIATADVDGDGDLDFAVANQWEPSNFYRNECPDCGAFLGLHLLLPLASLPPSGGDRGGAETPTTVYPGHPTPDSPLWGAGGGRPAIGATATVHHPDGRRLVAQVDGGNGHSGARSPDLHFGLGKIAPQAQLQVELRWRDSNGYVHQETLQLSPGWHTLLLGQRN